MLSKNAVLSPVAPGETAKVSVWLPAPALNWITRVMKGCAVVVASVAMIVESSRT
ncbi:MAG TPA: hypothetical protein VJ281_09740 [Chthoniobacterales bacterium]|nr:hypothetical protein [Chthoniobacterales bacterium]